MRVIFAILLGFLLQVAEPRQHQLDLEPLLRDPAALQKLRILYSPPVRKTHQEFVVFGDGSVILQAYPNRPMALTEVPTCRSKVSPDRINGLVRLIIQRHFFDLPEKQFIFVYAAQGPENLELRTIAIDNGIGKASRTFGVGEYAGKEESIPPDFSAIEEELKQRRDSAFPPAGKTCHFEPLIKFWD